MSDDKKNMRGHTLEEYVEARKDEGCTEEKAKVYAELDYYAEAPLGGWGDD